MTPARRAEILVKMARAALRGYWSGDRPHEKRMLTIASKMLDALADTPEGAEFKAHKS